MPSIIWTPASLVNLQRLYQFLAAKDKNTAAKAIAAIRQATTPLTTLPNIGRPIADMPSEYREILIDFGHSGYVLLYRLEQNQVIILAIRHQREVGYS